MSSVRNEGTVVARVVVVEPIHGDGLARLRDRFGDAVVALAGDGDDAALAAALEDAEAILVRTRPLPGDVLAKAVGLKTVAKHGVGCDNIDVAHMTARGLPVSVTPDANATSVAEHTMALLLACAKRLIAQNSASRDAVWSARETLGAVELAGKTIAIVGMGRVGSRVARLCEAFAMRVIGFDPAATGTGYEMATDLDAALADADAVSLHLPFSPASANLFDEARLKAVKRGAILVNCARGGIVDETALISALDEGRIAGYGTDVLAQEPFAATDPLLGRADVVATMHTAAMTAEARRAMALQSAGNVIAALEGRLDPATVFNRRELGL